MTNGNSVRLSLDNDTKSAALAARSPRHGNSPGNFGHRTKLFDHLVGAGEQLVRQAQAQWCRKLKKGGGGRGDIPGTTSSTQGWQSASPSRGDCPIYDNRRDRNANNVFGYF